jgi:hypothetical protein
MGAFQISDLAAETGRPAWTRRQSRRLHSPESPFETLHPRLYPHGGSLHYPLNTWKGALYGRVERALMNSTDLFLFESAFARDTYQRTVGTPTGAGALRVQWRNRRRIRPGRDGR